MCKINKKESALNVALLLPDGTEVRDEVFSEVNIESLNPDDSIRYWKHLCLIKSHLGQRSFPFGTMSGRKAALSCQKTGTIFLPILFSLGKNT